MHLFQGKLLGSVIKHDNNIILVWHRSYERRRAVDYQGC